MGERWLVATSGGLTPVRREPVKGSRDVLEVHYFRSAPENHIENIRFRNIIES